GHGDVSARLRPWPRALASRARGHRALGAGAARLGRACGVRARGHRRLGRRQHCARSRRSARRARRIRARRSRACRRRACLRHRCRARLRSAACAARSGARSRRRCRPLRGGAGPLASTRSPGCLGVPARLAVAFAAVLKDLVRRLGRTPVGKNLIHAAVLRDPSTMRFRNVEQWPADVRGFEDLAFMFSSNQLNHGVASLQFDEAALLFRLARDAQSGPFAEIGRFKGGSTIVFAAALPDGVELWSYDLHVALRADMPGAELDEELRTALERYGLAGKVHLVVADSSTVEPPSRELELLFVDGDHSYEGAKAD